MDAVLVAEKIGAKAVVNLSNIKQVYTSDPRMNPDMKPIKNITWDNFLELLPTDGNLGLAVVRPVAARKAKEMGIDVAIINGKDIGSLSNYLDGKSLDTHTSLKLVTSTLAANSCAPFTWLIFSDGSKPQLCGNLFNVCTHVCFGTSYLLILWHT